MILTICQSHNNGNVFRLSLKQFQPDFNNNDGIVATNVVLSSDLESVGQGHYLQKIAECQLLSNYF